MKKIIYIILLFFLFSCDDTLFNTGDIITKKIEITDFDEIFIEDIFDIYLIQDTVCKISAKGGSNILQNLEFNVDENKILTINNTNSARWSRDYDIIELYISVDTLSLLNLNAPSNVYTQNTLITPDLKIFSIAEYAEYNIDVICNNCYIASSGTSGGIIRLNGATNTFTFWARASFQVNAEEFNANYVMVKTESIADCKIHVLKELSIEILRSGNVYYKGDPYKIDYLNEKAKEQLIKLD